MRRLRTVGAACVLHAATAAWAALPASPSAAQASCGDGPVPEDQARCVAREDGGPPDFSWAPRAVLALPRLAFRTVTELLAAGARIEDQYRLTARVEDLFWNDERTFGVMPLLAFGTGLGSNAGVQVVDRDLFGAREGLRLRAAYGGPFRQLYDARLHGGRRFGRVRPSLLVGYERDDRPQFWGLGEGDTVPASQVDAPLDARAPGPAVRADYRVETLRAAAAADVRLSPSWTTQVAHVWRYRQLGTGDPDDLDETWLTEVYADDSLDGFREPLIDAYSQVALVFDGRRAGPGAPRALPASGLRAQFWSGLQAEANAPHSAFGRVGFDVQPFVPLLRGNRVLHLRLRGAAALGPLDAIPFLDLPSLGGSMLLRGYSSQRFRGRVTLLASAEYRYPVQENIAAYVFTDAGRAWPGFDAVSFDSLGALRVGFGAGLQVYGARSGLFRLQLASSIDGGFFIHLRVNTTDELGATY